MSFNDTSRTPFPPTEGQRRGEEGSEARYTGDVQGHYTGDIAISVQNLSKCYQIYDTPRDRLKQFVTPRLQRLAGQSPKQYFRDFWALKDVSFVIKKGETVGIIGRNGSGKSTLLQIICGTLTPTSGSVETSGRIAALLELGSGFNPEFTGRENIYMNAAVLGLSKEEVDARFDDIAAFADIGEFIEQPVKIYSTGMYVRLAFSVIAHVDAEILVVDEALSVGDAVFTQKCMRFIRSFQGRGTLIFVSHDTSSVQNLCKTGIWLGNGQIQKVGTSKNVAEAYLQYTLQEVYGDVAKLSATSSAADLSVIAVASPEDEKSDAAAVDHGSLVSVRENTTNATGWKTGAAEIVSVSLEKIEPGPDGVFVGGEKVCLVILAKANEALGSPILGFLVRDKLGQDLFGENTLSFTAITPCPVKPGQKFRGEFVFRLPMLPNGQYAVMASVADGDLYNNIQHHWLHDALIINVSSSKTRWGLVGIPFERVVLGVRND
ncbi:MAG: ABC transporter ATP-binding protein [Sulfuricaulis sp.]|uniref:ABC transporter ATP-binding protein n=1 Tax=Sulfuricaulis sp. TaxID=2003553 RepID=UPI003C4079CB